MKNFFCFKFTWFCHKSLCLWVLLIALAVTSCTETGSNHSKKQSLHVQEELSNLKIRAASSLQRARSYVLKDMEDLEWQPGDIWVLRKCLSRKPDAKLQKFVDETAENLSDHPFAVVINPNAKPIDLPKKPGKGFQKLTYYCVAPFGNPKKRAVKFIEDFLAVKGEGYVLTHQLMVIIWAQERGLKLPAKIVNRKKELIKEIAEEHLSSDKDFSDLYVERATLLMMYGRPGTKETKDYIETILNAQQKDGYWYAYKNIVTFDGETVLLGGVQRIDIAHPTALSMLAIATFLETF